ncbi:helix-turn-helix domain-containing protein [Tatumella morbirosei]|uniref:helix-turn-helix domain-containing protein n=1 Tax=Tatumella morbirosei TaxID=642227 RepID=UPI00069C0EC2|nr:AraC family transcriptional regulator [Tatumella morbirosei]
MYPAPKNAANANLSENCSESSPVLRLETPMIDKDRPVTPLRLAGKRREQGTFLEQHQHPQGLIIAIHHGLVILHSGDEVTCVLPGQFCWIPGKQDHGTHWFGAIEGMCLYLQPELGGAFPDVSVIFTQTALTDAMISRLADAPLLEPGHVLSLLDSLTHEIALLPRGGFHLPMPTESRLQQLTHRLLDRPDLNHNIEEWAQQAGMSLSTLSRRFRQQTGITPGQWRQQARMLHALELLFSGQSVTEVSLAVGYDSLSAFIHGFRKTFGITPSRYFSPSPAPQTEKV